MKGVLAGADVGAGIGADIGADVGTGGTGGVNMGADLTTNHIETRKGRGGQQQQQQRGRGLSFFQFNRNITDRTGTPSSILKTYMHRKTMQNLNKNCCLTIL